jgi:hypothetical protein
VEQKKKRAQWIINNYDQVTSRNGKYAPELLKEKLLFEEVFFKL